MNPNTFITDASTRAAGLFPVIADRAQEAIAVLDADGVVRYANASWVRMHGYARRSECIGKPISAFHSSEQMEKDVRPLLLEAGNHSQISGPVGHITAQGRCISSNTTMVALKDSGGLVRAVVVFATETSECEQLKELIRHLEREIETRTAELQSAGKRLEERAKELDMFENLLSTRGDELSAVNSQLWQCMSARAQADEQLKELNTQLTDKEKELLELKSRLQSQAVERDRMERQWKSQYSELTSAIKRLRDDLLDMKHREVEFLEDIEVKTEAAGAGSGLDVNQLKELSEMAKKFATT